MGNTSPGTDNIRPHSATKASGPFTSRSHGHSSRNIPGEEPPGRNSGPLLKSSTTPVKERLKSSSPTLRRPFAGSFR